MDGLQRKDISRKDTYSFLWSCDTQKHLDGVLRLPWNSLTQHLNNYLCNIFKMDGLPNKTCQEETHLSTCDPMIWKHLNGDLELPLSQHFACIT